MMHYDSTGKVVQIGDRVRFRGEKFTIKRFYGKSMRGDISLIEFEEQITHSSEIPDEWSIDLI